ncbi:MAG: CIA30 family protein, partial [Candidatus Saganbacteria bacterium]|nr:CIA30 family protein [Candidatus Saganbacteria bacterium]
VFDNAVLKVEKTTKLLGGDQSSAAQTGNYALSVKGATTRWYVGGMGTMVGVDASKYNTIEMDVYGTGDGSGRIKVELYDDDNGNKDIEVDSAWVPKFDDLWNYEINVNWTGWKHITIPFGALVLTNPGRGNGKADFDLTGGSGGLVKIQLIFVANAEKGEINYSVDNIELTNK